MTRRSERRLKRNWRVKDERWLQVFRGAARGWHSRVLRFFFGFVLELLRDRSDNWVGVLELDSKVTEREREGFKTSELVLDYGD